ncbi:hypothetical protein FLONG3_7417 [Fusarium longipes]|uniref:Uncharacterized protein n=1 Tax=Fusarium longipes TaxID=694270 RepID=A0A395SE54_9HYPO|nr:hypothetical protein FLONG3_7417 [Fusarium longipes]
MKPIWSSVLVTISPSAFVASEFRGVFMLSCTGILTTCLGKGSKFIIHEANSIIQMRSQELARHYYHIAALENLRLRLHIENWDTNPNPDEPFYSHVVDCIDNDEFEEFCRNEDEENSQDNEGYRARLTSLYKIKNQETGDEQDTCPEPDATLFHGHVVDCIDQNLPRAYRTILVNHPKTSDGSKVQLPYAKLHENESLTAYTDRAEKLEPISIKTVGSKKTIKGWS